MRHLNARHLLALQYSLHCNQCLAAVTYSSKNYTMQHLAGRKPIDVHHHNTKNIEHACSILIIQVLKELMRTAFLMNTNAVKDFLEIVTHLKSFTTNASRNSIRPQKIDQQQGRERKRIPMLHWAKQKGGRASFEAIDGGLINFPTGD